MKEDFVSGEEIDSTLPDLQHPPHRAHKAQNQPPILEEDGRAGVVNGESVYVVESVIDVDHVDAKVMAKVRWGKPYGPDDDSWEPVSSLPFDVCGYCYVPLSVPCLFLSVSTSGSGNVGFSSQKR